ncbi:MAG: response regulator [Chitinophagales bacterium]
MADKIYKVFLVDDDVKTLIMLKHKLENLPDHKIKANVFAYGENCLDRMDEKPDIIVLDYHLNAIREDAQNGLQILKKIKAMAPDTHVIMVSGQEDMQTALETIREGAYDYIIKNDRTMQRLLLVINKIIFNHERVAV